MIIITYACYHTLSYKGIQSRVSVFLTSVYVGLNRRCRRTLLYLGRHTVYSVGGASPTFARWVCCVLTLKCNDRISVQLLCALKTYCNMSFFCRGWLYSASKGVILLIPCFSHCSLRVNEISLESYKLLMWKSADSGDEKLRLGLVNELACQVRSSPCFLSVFSLNSICFLVCAALTETVQRGCLSSCSFLLMPKGDRYHVWTEEISPLAFSCKTPALGFFPCIIHLHSIVRLFQRISGDSSSARNESSMSLAKWKCKTATERMAPWYSSGADFMSVLSVLKPFCLHNLLINRSMQMNN